MRVRQVGGDQGSCDVGVALRLRPCVFVCVCVFLGRMYRGCVLRYIFEMKSKEVSSCLANVVSVSSNAGPSVEMCSRQL